MSEQDLERVRNMFRGISETGQIDMRKRACDKIKEFANNPTLRDSLQPMLDLLAAVSSLTVDQ